MSLFSRCVLSLVILGGVFAKTHAAEETILVSIHTELGIIEVELYPERAPRTVANFLRYVDDGQYEGGVFHRTVTLGNQPRNPVKIEVIQAAINPRLWGRDYPPQSGYPPIALERTSETALRHLDGTVSMARTSRDSATSGFFICIGDQPELDYGGRRHRDRQGFAAFGRVVDGMHVVRNIQMSPYEKQSLKPPIRIERIERGGR